MYYLIKQTEKRTFLKFWTYKKDVVYNFKNYKKASTYANNSMTNAD